LPARDEIGMGRILSSTVDDFALETVAE